MPIAILEKEIRTLPAESMLEMMDFIQYLKFKYNSENQFNTQKNTLDVSKRFGSFPELSQIPNDIDFCNDEIAEMFGV